MPAINSDTWEAISTNGSRITKRLRVFGGWLVDVEDTANTSSTVIFISDPRQEWEVD